MSHPGASHITFHQFQRALYFIAAARRAARQVDAAVAGGGAPADGDGGGGGSSIAQTMVGAGPDDGAPGVQEYATDDDVEELYREVASLSPAWRHAHGMSTAVGRHWRGADRR